jgi:hypothetical protein
VAKPGNSAHQTGQAADLGPPSQFGWIAKNASKYGLARPAPRSEPWHVQAMGDPTGAQVVQKAQTWIGTNYVYGGNGTAPGQGVDCSRFVQEVYSSLGVSLPRTTYEQCQVGTKVGGIGSAMPGDLIFYDYEGPNSHVAIYIGNNKQIAAPETGQKVQQQSVDTGHITQIRRVVAGVTGVAAAQTATSAAGGGAVAGGGGATAPGLGNTFLAQVAAGTGWAPGAGSAAGTPTSSGPASSGATATSGGSTTGSTAIVGGSSNVNNPTSFSRAVLASLGLSTTQSAVTDFNAWQQAEGQWTASGNYNAAQMHNPLNTRLNLPGSSNLGGLTTSYPTWAEGIQATVQTLKQANMSPVLQALSKSDNLSAFSSALESTPWASSHYGGRSFPEPSGVYAMGDPLTAATGASLTTGSTTLSGTGRTAVTINMPLQTIGLSSQDAQNLANTVVNLIKQQTQSEGIGIN